MTTVLQCGLSECAPGDIDTEMKHYQGGISFFNTRAVVSTLNCSWANVLISGSAVLVEDATGGTSILTRLSVCEDAGGGDSIAAYGLAIINVDQSNFANLSNMTDGVFYLGSVSSNATVTGCHFFSIARDSCFYVFSRGFFSVFNCYFDHAMQPDVKYAATSGNVEFATATLIWIEMDFVVCPQAVPTVASPTGSGRESSIPATRSPSPTASPSRSPSAAQTAPSGGPSKRNIVIIVVMCSVLPLVGVGIFMFWKCRQNNAGRGLGEEPLMERAPEHDVMNV
jgi:hypothetical protein